MGDEVINTLGECIGNPRPHVEVIENLIMPISYSTNQRIEMEAEFLGNARKPLLVFIFCILSLDAVVDEKELFLQPVGLTEQGEPSDPRFEQNPLHRLQVLVSLEQQETISLKSSSLLIGQGRLQRLPVAVEALVRQSRDVELIDDDNGHGKSLEHSNPVGVPHIHCHDFDLIRFVESHQPVDNGVLIAIIQNIQNGILTNVGQHAARSAQGEYLIDAQHLGSNDRVHQILSRGMSDKDVPYGLGIDAKLSGNVAVGSAGALPLNVFQRPLGKPMVSAQEGSGFDEGLLAILTAVPLPLDLEHHSLAHGRKIDVGRGSHPELNDEQGSAFLTAVSQWLVLNNHPSGVVYLFLRNDFPRRRIEEFQAERLA